MLQCCYDNLHETRNSSKFCIWQFFYFFIFILQTIIENWREKFCGLLPKIQSEKQNPEKFNMKSTSPHMKLFLTSPRWYGGLDCLRQSNRVTQSFLTENWQYLTFYVPRSWSFVPNAVKHEGLQEAASWKVGGSLPLLLLHHLPQSLAALKVGW